MFQQFLRALRNSCHLGSDTRLVVACSGGADSTALLHLLSKAAERLKLRLTVAHLDHGLRVESRADADFVSRLAERLELPCVVMREDVAAIAHADHDNLEAVGRKVRRRFLQQVAADTGSSLIALGHHRDDQAETVLFRLLRGCGTSGLSAMSPCDPPYIRPLLRFSREQLQGYLRDEKLQWREDCSNLDLSRTRNRLRHQVLPLLGELQTDVGRKLADLAARIASDEDFWFQEVSAWIERHVCQEADGVRFPLAPLTEQHPALRARIWLQLLRYVGSGEDYGVVHLAACEKLLDSQRPQLSIDLPGLWLGKRYEEILLRTAPFSTVEAWQVEITATGDYLLPDGRCLQVEITESGRPCDVDTVEFAAEQVPFPLQLRNRRPGDRFFPEGSQGSRKLKEYFIDAKVRHEERAEQPLLVADQVIWIVGVRRCQGRVAGEGGRVLRCTLVQGVRKDKTA